MTGRAYLGEVIHQEMSELLDKQVNAQEEKTSRVHASSHKPTKVCDENERNKQEKKMSA